MIKIYHNPRCSKSREGLKILQDANTDVEIIKYLEYPPSKEELEEIIGFLGITPEALIRKNERIWKEEFKGKQLSNDDLIAIMIRHPKLIERPIFIKGTKAIIGRPPQLVVEFLKES